VRRATVRVSADVATRIRQRPSVSVSRRARRTAAAGERRRFCRARRSGGRLRRPKGSSIHRRHRRARVSRIPTALRLRDHRPPRRRARSCASSCFPAAAATAIVSCTPRATASPAHRRSLRRASGRAPVLVGDGALGDAVYGRARKNVEAARVYEQRRFRPQSGDGRASRRRWRAGELAPVELEVNEGGVKFVVDDDRARSLGALPPNLREGRKAIANLASGRRLLNLFSYTGAFSVYGAKAGAREVVSATWRPRRTRAAAQLRQRARRGAPRVHRRRRVQGPGQDGERKRQFDLSRARPAVVRAVQGARRVQRAEDYRELVEGCLASRRRARVVAAVSNTLKISAEESIAAIGDAAAALAPEVRVVERRGCRANFPVPAGFLEGATSSSSSAPSLDVDVGGADRSSA